MDEFGAPCGWVSKQDVLLTISSLSDGGSSVGSVKRITVVEPGVFDVIYQVLEAVTELWLRVSVCGVTVGSGSRRVSLTPPFQTLVGSLSSYHRGMYNGIAVSPDGNWLLLSCALNHYLHDEEQFEGEEDWLAVSGPECKLYLTSLRYEVGAVGTRVFGSRGGGDAQFNYPHGVCFGRDNTLLVCDTGNNRVQELSLGGAFIRAFPCGGCFVISTNGAVIAIGGSSRDAGNIASLHDYNTGVLIRTIGAPLPLDAPPPAPKFTSSICFTEDGLKLFALETSTGVAAMGVWQRGPPRILEFTKDGTFTQVVASGPGAVPSDCAQLSVTPAGRMP